jgi:large repetitive protein
MNLVVVLVIIAAIGVIVAILVQKYSMHVAPAPLSLSPAAGSLPAAQVGAAYSQQMSASGGVPPYTFAVASGVLPSGLSLNASSGLISGIPSATGDSAFDISVTDSAL